MATIDDIKQRAQQVQNATDIGENTAARVGGVLVDLADHMEQAEEDIANIDVNFSTGQSVSEVGIDSVPTTGSSNVVMSGGVAGELTRIKNAIMVDGVPLSMGSAIGYIISTSAWTWLSSGSNHYLVAVSAGDSVKVTANSTANAVCIWLTSNAAPSNNNPAPVVSHDAYTINAGESAILTAPTGAHYLYLMGTHAQVAHKPSEVIGMGDLKTITEDLAETVVEDGQRLVSLESRMPKVEQSGSSTRYTFTDAESGYYNKDNHAIVASDYWSHKAIAYDGSDGGRLYFTSSTGPTAAACFFKIGSSYQLFGQDSGGTSQSPVAITVDIPSGTTEILISVNNNDKNTAYADVIIPGYVLEDAVSERMVKELLSNELPSTGLNLKKRRASVSFIFDDGTAKDAQIKGIFDNHSMKCGFAVYSPINSRYKTYYDNGFEILAHASAPISNPTEEQERAQMQTALSDVVALVGECHGWVTPSSALADQFKPLVYDYYEYGYTVYKGTTATPSDAAMTKDLKSYGLWRSALQSLTLAEQKAIVDYALANNLMICFYGHAADLDTTNYLTTANLNSLLSYCTTVGIDVVTPYASVGNFFAYRHNEDS